MTSSVATQTSRTTAKGPDLGNIGRQARLARWRLAWRRLAGGVLLGLSLPLVALGAYIIAGSLPQRVGSAPLWWVGGLSVLPVFIGLGLAIKAIFGRPLGPLIRGAEGLDPRLAEGLRSVEQLAATQGLEPLAAAFRERHAEGLGRQLALLPPADLVNLGPLGSLAGGWLCLVALLAAALTWQPRLASRLVWSLGLDDGPDRLPELLDGPGARLQVEITPPRYTGLPIRRATVGHAPLEVPVGSQVRLVGVAEVPVAAVSARLPSGRVARAQLLGLRHFRLDFVAKLPGEVDFVFWTSQGLRRVGRAGPRFVIQADAPPQVQLTPADPVLELETPEPLELRYQVRDDHGLLAVRLRYRVEGGDEGVRVLQRGARFGPSRRRRLQGDHRLDLRRLPLGPGSRLRFWLEASDNRTLAAEQGVSRTPEQVIRIVGKRRPQAQVLDRVRALLERAATRLADRLEEPTEAPCGTRLHARQVFAVADTHLAEAVARLEKSVAGDAELPLLLRRGVAALGAPRRKLLAALALEAHRVGVSVGDLCVLLARAEARSAAVVKRLEDLVLALDDLSGRAVLEQMQDLAKQLGRLVTELAELSEAQRKQPTAQRARQIKQRLAQARQLMQQLAGLRASLQDDALDEHVNRYAYERKKTQKLLEQVAGRKGGRREAKKSSGDAAVEKLKRQVERLKEALAEGLDRFRSFHPVPGERDLRRTARAARKLSAEQQGLERRSSRAPSSQLAAEQERLARKADELAKRAARQVPQAGEAAGEAARQMRRHAGQLRKGSSDPKASREARKALHRASKALEQQGRVSKKKGSQRRDGKGTDGDGPVEVPPAGGSLPRQLREAILEGGRADWPAEFAPALRRYYESLLR